MTADRLGNTFPAIVPRALLALLALCWGCAHAQGVADAHRFPARTNLGTIGVMVDTTLSDVRLAAPPSSRIGQAGVGAITGAGVLILVGGSIGNIGGLALGVLLSPVGAVVGAVMGATKTTADRTDVAQGAQALREVVVTFDIAEALLRGVLDVGQADRPRLVRAPARDAAARDRVDTRLEIDVRRVALGHRLTKMTFQGRPPKESLREAESPPGVSVSRMILSTADPTLTFEARLRMRLVRGADGSVLFERDFQHIGSARRSSEWAADEGRALADALAEACRELSARIVTDLF